MAMICDDDTDFDPVISHSRESCFPHIVTARPRSGRRAAAPMPKIVDRTWAGGRAFTPAGPGRFSDAALPGQVRPSAAADDADTAAAC